MAKDKDIVKSDVQEAEVVDSGNDFVVIATPRGYVLSGTFRLHFGEKEETFSTVTERLDSEITFFRNAAIKRIARELKLQVNFID